MSTSLDIRSHSGQGRFVVVVQDRQGNDTCEPQTLEPDSQVTVHVDEGCEVFLQPLDVEEDEEDAA
jgi:hypothetical protein